ncbi:unnamed protein product, partial [Ectocarpus sp. 12 AP-2014]
PSYTSAAATSCSSATTPTPRPSLLERQRAVAAGERVAVRRCRSSCERARNFESAGTPSNSEKAGAATAAVAVTAAARRWWRLLAPPLPPPGSSRWDNTSNFKSPQLVVVVVLLLLLVWGCRWPGGESSRRPQDWMGDNRRKQDTFHSRGSRNRGSGRARNTTRRRSMG